MQHFFFNTRFAAVLSCALLAVAFQLSTGVLFAEDAKPADEAPKAEQAAPQEKTEPAKPDQPEAPKAEAPKAEAPKAEAPKAEEPKAEEPKAEKPEAPAVEEATPVAPPKSLDDVRTIEAKVMQLRDHLRKCTVGVRMGASQGSAVIVSKDGLVLTAGHVIRPPDGKEIEEVTVILHDGKKLKGKPLGRCEWADAGMLKIVDEGEYEFAEIGTSGDLQRGQWCIATGHPLGYVESRPPVVRVGRVLLPQPHAIHTDSPIVAGDSGGPLFDMDGKVIGINSRISPRIDDNFHVPIDIFHEYWELMEAGVVCGKKAPGRDSHDVRQAFADATRDAAQCVVRVKGDGKDVALGTIVGPNGWIVTKATRLRDKKKVECQFRKEQAWEAAIVGIDPEYDLAMLKVEATGLPAIEWGSTDSLDVGQWLSTLGPDHDLPFALGVCSVPNRKIPQSPGTLGVVVEDHENGAKVAQVMPNSPAQKAGMKAGDVITHVDGVKTPDRDTAVASLKKHRPGDKVKIKFQRGDQSIEKDVVLGVLSTPATQKRDFQNNSNIGMSTRRDGFPVVLQHDAVVRPEHCGSPVVNLSGKVMGLNIARAGRVETYAIPSEALLPRLYDLMSGRLAPPKPAAEPQAKEATPAPAVAEEKKPAAEAKPAEEKEPAEEATPAPKPAEQTKPTTEKKPEGTSRHSARSLWMAA